MSLVFFWLYAHPRRYVGNFRPHDFKLKAEPLTLRTADGVNLDAWFIPNQKSSKAVIVCHGYPMDKSDVLGMTAFLARKFNLLYFDFRATGKSGGFFSTGGARETRDLDAAVSFLQSRGFKSAGAFGFSMGGATVLLSANPAIKARVLDAPYAGLGGELNYIFGNMGAWARPMPALMRVWSLLLMDVNISSVSPAAAAARLTTPLLLIHGDADTQVPLANSLRIKAAYPAAELWVIKKAGHGENWLNGGNAYEQRISDFFEKNL
jgi:pimeloyl-ACP methyl ester carboxylesterase